MRRLGVVAVAGALCLAAVACGGDSSDSDEDAQPTAAATVAVSSPTTEAEEEASATEATETEVTEEEPVADLSGEDVCALNTIDEVAAALGVTVEEAEPSDSGTPSCSYTFTTTEGTGNNIVVAVMREDEDLGGLSGADGFEFAIELNRRYGGDAEESAVSVGDDALFMDGEAVGLLIVRQGERVMTIAGTTLTVEAATAIAEAATGRL